MAKKKKAAKAKVSNLQVFIFLMMLLGSMSLLYLNVNYPDAYSTYFMYSGVGVFVLAILYFYLVRIKKA